MSPVSIRHGPAVHAPESHEPPGDKRDSTSSCTDPGAGRRLTCLPLASHVKGDEATLNALESFFDSVDANGGSIMAEQIPAQDDKPLFALDVRDAGQFAKEHTPGAVNIEWRQIFAQRAKLPKRRTLLVCCNTSSFAGQIAMALRLDGFENDRVPGGSYNEWRARGGMQAHARATWKS